MSRIVLWSLYAAFWLSLVGWQGHAQDKKDDVKKEEKKVDKKPPQGLTFAKVPYGNHERQVLDFYQAKSDKPTPLVLFIHGGGWQGGDKSGVGNVKPYLDAGISVAAINYRYVKNGVEEKVQPPVKAPLEDAARALQFIRSKAIGMEYRQEAHRRPQRAPAGACSSLWLAFHDDMANPKSSDPIARRSTRLYCAPSADASRRSIPRSCSNGSPITPTAVHAFGLKDIRGPLRQARQASCNGSTNTRRWPTSPRMTHRSACSTAATRTPRWAASTRTRPTPP